jgi:hypothetical protein
MNRRLVTIALFAAMMVPVLLATDGTARQARRRDLQQQQQTELDITGMSPDALRKSFIGTWDDQGGRFWFTIGDITGDEIRSARFRLAHLKSGRIEGNRLTLLSMSCVPIVGCYSYTIRGTLLAHSQMDMRATDETGDTVHFVLIRK